MKKAEMAEHRADLAECLDACHRCGIRPRVEMKRLGDNRYLYSLRCCPDCDCAASFEKDRQFHRLMVAWNREQRKQAARMHNSLNGWMSLARKMRDTTS
jgi:hypothetical protein